MAKEYLSQVFNLRGEIDKLERERAKLESQTVRTTNITPNKVQTSKGNGSENLMVNMTYYSVEISKATSDLYNLQFKISSEISRMKNLKHRQLLRLRYTLELSWEEIAEDMGYDIRWIHRLHGFALQEFDEAILSHKK